MFIVFNRRFSVGVEIWFVSLQEGGVTQEEARRLPLESYSNYRIFMGERHGVVQRWVSLGEANWTWMVEPTVPFEF